LRAALASAGALHIAAPFRLNSASPLFSPVLLAASPIEGELVPAPAMELEAREVFNLPASAEVVMISDPAALSMRDAAAAITPVYWAWRTAGATTLIVRRWGGNHELSNQIVAAFYQRLAAGEPPAAAFDAARAAVRETEAGRGPAAWAGWIVLTGR
jgi:CHAT domain-containing protein